MLRSYHKKNKKHSAEKKATKNGGQSSNSAESATLFEIGHIADKTQIKSQIKI